jgi:hypothetical protein
MVSWPGCLQACGGTAIMAEHEARQQSHLLVERNQKGDWKELGSHDPFKDAPPQ